MRCAFGNQHTSEARENFDLIDYYRFSSKLAKAADIDDAVDASDPGPETRLYEALNHVLDDSPDGVVCLTDGLDTTNGDVSNLIDLAFCNGRVCRSTLSPRRTARAPRNS